MNPRIYLFFVALLSLSAAHALGLSVVASQSIIGDWVRQVAGDEVEVTVIAGPEEDPHAIDFRPSQAKAVANADVVFELGWGAEPWMDALYQGSGSDVRRIALTVGLDLIRPGDTWEIKDDMLPECCQTDLSAPPTSTAAAVLADAIAGNVGPKAKTMGTAAAASCCSSKSDEGTGKSMAMLMADGEDASDPQASDPQACGTSGSCGGGKMSAMAKTSTGGSCCSTKSGEATMAKTSDEETAGCCSTKKPQATMANASSGGCCSGKVKGEAKATMASMSGGGCGSSCGSSESKAPGEASRVETALSAPAPGNFDAHVWHDVKQAMSMVIVITDVLIEEMPEAEATFVANSDAYLKTLSDLDQWVVGEVRRVMLPARQLVTEHASMNYFARRYGFSIFGTVLNSYSTETADPSARDIIMLSSRMRVMNVPAVFGDGLEPSKLVKRVAESAGVEPVGIFTGYLSKGDGPASTYVDLVRYNVSKIVGALGAQSVAAK